MKEIKLLNMTIQLVKKDEIMEAYNYLVSNIDKLDNMTSQVYNFLYCLASSCGLKEEAIEWLQEAILIKEFWYRPEVFEDTDLDNIREDIRFKTCLELSERRYLESLKNTKPICTWKNKYRDKLALCLHGNQQNIEICKKSWSFLNSYDYQVEYIQSSELDSYQLFRWEDNGDGPQQLKESIDIIDWNSYESKLLAGFSAGCNVILRAINDYDIKCDKIILQSPWIPIVNNKLNEILKEIKQKKIELLIICGKEDDDCLTQSKALATKALEFGIKVEAIWVEGLAHDFPENFNEIVGNYLK